MDILYTIALTYTITAREPSIYVTESPCETGLYLGGPTKVKAHKPFLFTEGSLKVENDHCFFCMTNWRNWSHILLPHRWLLMLIVFGVQKLLFSKLLKCFYICFFKSNKICISVSRSSGAMDNASAYGAEDCRFDPCLDRFFSKLIERKTFDSKYKNGYVPMAIIFSNCFFRFFNLLFL